MMHWYGGGMPWGSWLGMGLFWVLLLALIVWLVVRLLPSGNRPAAPGAGTGETPEDILDRRFARGEIDEHTYLTQRATLAAQRGSKR